LDPGEPSSSILLSILQPWSLSVAFGLIGMLVLLLLSALISGSEVAFFSLSPQDKKLLEEEGSTSSKLVTDLLKKPKTLLATILIANNLVNVAIIILSSILMEMMFDFGGRELLAFLIQVIVVTLVILLVGEISPKVYATKHAMTLSMWMARPMMFIRRLFYPFSQLLVKGTRKIDKRARDSEGGGLITADELNHALELTTDKNTGEDEKRILSGIVKFGSTEVRQVMTPRIDVISVDIKTPYSELQSKIVEHGYSRIPVYEESFDKVVGILYVKDLLNHLNEGSDFNWQNLLRQPTFVTENKKLDDLLREFQDDKNHMAVVVDEYGGSSGVITLEDIIEEIVGEISDEFDDEELVYTKIDDNNYVFEGKTALIDIYRVLDISGEEFEKVKGDSDSIAGFVLELSGKIPQKNERIRFKKYLFTVEAADRRRVKRIKLTLLSNDDIK
jgi:putative hemolysin